MLTTNKKLMLSGILIFLSGILLGAIGTGYLIKSTIQKHRHGNVEKRVDHMMKFLKWRLNLSEEQEERIRPIVFQAHKKAMHLHQEMEPRITNIIEDAFRDVDKQLSPPQQVKLSRMAKRMKGRWFSSPPPHSRQPPSTFMPSSVTSNNRIQ